MTRGKLWMAVLAAFVLGLAVAGGAAWVAARGAQPPAGAKAATRYQCPMHPTMISDRPADCPICKALGMQHGPREGVTDLGGTKIVTLMTPRTPVRLPRSRRDRQRRR